MVYEIEDERLNRIRESERKSHIEMYSKEELYKSDSWLSKPIKTVTDIIPLFDGYQELHVLDLGCGIGRNCIAVAEFYKNIVCSVDCVDLLEIAIEKLNENAKMHDVDKIIHGTVQSIEEYQIEKEKYDFIMAISAVEHINSRVAFEQKLIEIKNGIRQKGIVCLVINSDVQEFDKETKHELEAQFEVNLPTEELRVVLQDIFRNWEVIKYITQEQQYDIPRESGICELRTKVVTLVAKRGFYDNY